MEATGLEKGGIYRHFDSQPVLAEKAFEHAWKLVMDTRFEGINRVPNAADRLLQFLQNFRQRRAGLLAGGSPLLNTPIDSDDGNTPLCNKARQALDSWLESLQSIIEERQRNAEIRSDVDATELATLMIAALKGSLMLIRLQRKTRSSQSWLLPS